MIPTNTRIAIETKKTIPVGLDAIVAFASQGIKEVKTSHLAPIQQKSITRLMDSGGFKGKLGEVASELLELPRQKFGRLFLVGLGPKEKLNAEMIRQSAAAAIKAIRRNAAAKVAIIAPDFAGAVEAIASGLLLAGFDFQEYKGSAAKKDAADKQQANRPLHFTIISSDSTAHDQLERGRIIADAQNFARTIASRPGNVINPPALAKVAQQLAKELKLKIRILDEKQMTKMGMGGILAVGSGSIATPPRMIALEYNLKSKTKNPKSLLVIGKAITFDSGGISIKPADKMGKMIFDKCGGMAVLGIMYAVAKLKLPVRVVGILASAENILSSRSYRPGDILHMYNGVTVEVTNTDAEGRLVLGDALAWGIETYKPSTVVDLATLTGGVVVALGKAMAGVLSNSDELVKELADAANRAGEKIWRLPIGDEFRELMKSDAADIVNAGGREASSSQGGAFLSYFVPEDNSVPWAHLDIAGTADTEKELPYYAKGATGWGIRTVVEWIASKG